MSSNHLATTEASRPVACTPHSIHYTPRVDVVETADDYRLMVDVPGATSDSIDIQTEGNELRVHARVSGREPQNVKWLRREYGVGDFLRTFRVGEGVDLERVEADLAAGVLTLRLPKAPEARVRKIAIRGQ